MSKHGDDAVRVLRTIKKPTNAVKATIALTHATLEVAAAIREEKTAVNRQTAIIERLWNTPE